MEIEWFYQRFFLCMTFAVLFSICNPILAFVTSVAVDFQKP